METGTVDLFAPGFWLFGVLGILAGQGAVSAPLRRVLLAGVNAGFLLMLAGPSGLAWIILGVGGGYAALRGMAVAKRSGPVFWGVLAVLGGLFLIHKLGTGGARPSLSVLNPLLAAAGFSYTALRYADVLRVVKDGDHPPPDVLRFFNYILPFHMVAAGPIQSYQDYIEQPEVPEPADFRTVMRAGERIVFGLFKKFVLALLIQETFLSGFQAGGWLYFVEVQMFFIWLYLDFSAYSDVAVGLGTLMGVRTPENFDRPYFSRNLIEFWDRWHISLSLFVRRNLFVPLQLLLVRGLSSQRPVLTASASFIVAFLFVGLWHEVAWRYFLWGGMHAVGLVGVNAYRFALKERLGAAGLKRYREHAGIRFASGLLTFEYVAFSLAIIGSAPG